MIAPLQRVLPVSGARLPAVGRRRGRVGSSAAWSSRRSARQSAVRRAVRIPPAEAMRPEPPARYRRSVLERLGRRRMRLHAGDAHDSAQPRAAAGPVARRRSSASRSPSRCCSSACRSSTSWTLLIDQQFDAGDAAGRDGDRSSSRGRRRAIHEVEHLPGVHGRRADRAACRSRLRAGHRAADAGDHRRCRGRRS